MGWQPERVLVTGGAGRLGARVVRLMADMGVECTVLDRDVDVEADRVVQGAVEDAEAVESALDGVDAVIHTAALPSPKLGTPLEVFRANSLSTFTLLDAASRRGVERIVISSSFSITGLPWGESTLLPPHLPIDEDTALQVHDVYALTKEIDEASARMIAASSGSTVLALRFPLLGSPEDELRARAEQCAENPAEGRSDLWSYLDTRDAADACWAAVTSSATGFECAFVAAPNTISAVPTEDLLDRYLPDVARRRRFEGNEVPIDTGRASHLFGFTPSHVHSPEDLIG